MNCRSRPLLSEIRSKCKEGWVGYEHVGPEMDLGKIEGVVKIQKKVGRAVKSRL